jgi:4-hydroxybutyrate CoA-transferase
MSSAFAEGNADHLPLSTLGMHKLFSEDYIRINTAIIHLSPPNGKGFMSLGIMVDITRSIIEKADIVIAQVNSRMPMTRGDSMIHISDIDYVVEHDEELVTYRTEEPDPETREVGRNIARLIDDGSTLQVGFGRIPDAALRFLTDKRDLKIHSEIITDTVAELAASGAIAPPGTTLPEAASRPASASAQTGSSTSLTTIPWWSSGTSQA